MNLNKIVKIKAEGRANINSIMRRAREQKSTHDTIMRAYFARRIIWKNQGLPRYALSYLDGYYDGLVNDLYRELDFCYNIKGVLYCTGQNKRSTRKKLKGLRLHKLALDLPGNFYWIGSDIPYTIKAGA